MRKLDTPPATRLLFLARQARAEADHHEGVVHHGLIHVSNALAKAYRQLAGDSRNATPAELERTIDEAAHAITAASSSREIWNVLP